MRKMIQSTFTVKSSPPSNGSVAVRKPLQGSLTNAKCMGRARQIAWPRHALTMGLDSKWVQRVDTDRVDVAAPVQRAAQTLGKLAIAQRMIDRVEGEPALTREVQRAPVGQEV